MTADDYNELEIKAGRITGRTVSLLALIAQQALNLKPDGKCGPVTREALEPKPVLPPEPMLIDGYGLASGVVQMPAHDSWVGGALHSKTPQAIVAHTTATNPGTAETMAKRRARPFGQDPDDRMSSCHFWVETDGTIIQQASALQCAWHAGSSTAKKQPAPINWANYSTVGIEFVSRDDKNFPAVQIEAGKRLWRALVRKYNIPRARAMIQHATIDPVRRGDPGKEFMTVHAPAILDYAYAESV